MRLNHGAGDGLFGRFVAPDNELKHRIETLTFVNRDVNDGLCLVNTQQTVGCHQAAMAEQQYAIGRPHIEMAQPQLLVDKAKRGVHMRALIAWDRDVRQYDELQRIIFLTPNRA